MRKAVLNPRVDESRINAWGSFRSKAMLLSDIVNINQAIALKSDRAAHIFGEPRGKNYKPVLDGRDIQPFVMRWPGVYLRYDLKHIHSCKREDIFLVPEKVFVRRVAERIIACYDAEQFYALNTLVVLTPKEQCPLSMHALCGLLNANVMTEIYVEMFKSTKKVFSEVQARQLGSMVIPDPSADARHALVSEIEDIAHRLYEFGVSNSNLSFEDIRAHRTYVSLYAQLNVLVKDFLAVAR